jgi:hypothetical protein
MRITVVGVYTVNGMEPSQPTDLYTLAPHEDDAGTIGRRP